MYHHGDGRLLCDPPASLSLRGLSLGGADPTVLLATAPGILSWLRHVFVVLGGYIFTTGLLMLHVAAAALRSQRPFPIALMALAGLTSLGTMAAVNFAIEPDFKWLLAGFAAFWAAAVLVALFDTGRRTA